MATNHINGQSTPRARIESIARHIYIVPSGCVRPQQLWSPKKGGTQAPMTLSLSRPWGGRGRRRRLAQNPGRRGSGSGGWRVGWTALDKSFWRRRSGSGTGRRTWGRGDRRRYRRMLRRRRERAGKGKRGRRGRPPATAWLRRCLRRRRSGGEEALRRGEVDEIFFEKTTIGLRVMRGRVVIRSGVW